MNRRQFLTGATVATSVVVAGCTGILEDDEQIEDLESEIEALEDDLADRDDEIDDLEADIEALETEL